MVFIDIKSSNVLSEYINSFKIFLILNVFNFSKKLWIKDDPIEDPETCCLIEWKHITKFSFLYDTKGLQTAYTTIQESKAGDMEDVSWN